MIMKAKNNTRIKRLIIVLIEGFILGFRNKGFKSFS